MVVDAGKSTFYVGRFGKAIRLSESGFDERHGWTIRLSIPPNETGIVTVERNPIP